MNRVMSDAPILALSCGRTRMASRSSAFTTLPTRTEATAKRRWCPNLAEQGVDWGLKFKDTKKDHDVGEDF